MRRSGGRSRAWSSKNVKVLWSLGETELAGQDTGGANAALVRVLPYTPLTNGPIRVFKFNPHTPSVVDEVDPPVDDEQQQLTVHRIILKLAVLAQIQSYRSNGVVDYNGTGRLALPFPSPGGLSAETTTVGPLLNGDHASGQEGSQSYAEGQPLNWALIYETRDEANQSLPSAGFDTSQAVMWNKNRRIFAQGMVVPALYRPATISVDKKFGMRGMQLSFAAREVWQLSMAIWAPTDGASILTKFGIWQGESRVQYKRP